MFGILKPNWNHLSCKGEKDKIIEPMCRTCASIKRSYGNTGRIFLNYDAIFLSLFIPDILLQEFHLLVRPFRCLTQGGAWPGNIGNFLSDVTLYSTAIFVQDGIIDNEKKLPKSLSRYVLREGEKAYKHLQDAGVDMLCIDDLRCQIEDIEGNSEYLSFDKRSESCAKIYNIIFSSFARVVGAVNPHDLGSIGYDYGRATILLDSILDFYQDIQLGQYNPILYSTEFLGDSHNISLAKAKEYLFNLLTNLSDKTRTMSTRASVYLESIMDNLRHTLCEKCAQNKRWNTFGTALPTRLFMCPCFTVDPCTGETELSEFGICVIVICIGIAVYSDKKND